MAPAIDVGTRPRKPYPVAFVGSHDRGKQAKQLMMKVTGSFRGRIHRGTRQIGGTCVELEAEGARILLDLGLPLDADDVSEDLLPNVSGLRIEDPTLSAIVISHGHG